MKNFHWPSFGLGTAVMGVVFSVLLGTWLGIFTNALFCAYWFWRAKE